MKAKVGLNAGGLGPSKGVMGYGTSDRRHGSWFWCHGSRIAVGGLRLMGNELYFVEDR